MKRMTVALVIATLILPISRNAFAAETLLNVSAEVIDACSVDAVDINFGQVAGEATYGANGQVNVTCNVGTNYQVAIDAGSWYDPATGLRQVSSGGEYSAQYILLDDVTLDPVGDDCDLNSFPAPCLAGVGSGLPDSFPLLANLWPFTGIPAGTLLSDTIRVTIVY